MKHILKLFDNHMTHRLRLFFCSLSSILVFNVKSTVRGEHLVVYDCDSPINQCEHIFVQYREGGEERVFMEKVYRSSK